MNRPPSRISAAVGTAVKKQGPLRMKLPAIRERSLNALLDDFTILHVQNPICLRGELVVVSHNHKGCAASLV
jgi:hypothetical protein